MGVLSLQIHACAGDVLNKKFELFISINLLTVYYASCVLIGYSIRGLFVIAY